MLPVFITSNQIPLHVHAVFCQLHVHCIHLARGMMRMRIPSTLIIRVLPPVKYSPLQSVTTELAVVPVRWGGEHLAQTLVQPPSVSLRPTDNRQCTVLHD